MTPNIIIWQTYTGILSNKKMSHFMLDNAIPHSDINIIINFLSNLSVVLEWFSQSSPSNLPRYSVVSSPPAQKIIIKLFLRKYSVRKVRTFYLHLIFPVMMLMMMIMMILMMTDEFAKIFRARWWRRREGLKSTMRVWPIIARTDLRTRVELGVKEQQWCCQEATLDSGNIGEYNC